MTAKKETPAPTPERDCERQTIEPKSGGSVTLPKPKKGADDAKVD